MADDTIKINLDLDVSQSINQINEVKEGIKDIKTSVSDMPNMSHILDSSLQKTNDIADSLIGKIEELQHERQTGGPEKDQIISTIQEGLKDLSTLKNLQGGNSEYGVTIARQWLNGLPKAVQKEFDSIAPKIATIVRTRMSTLSSDGLHFNGTNLDTLVRQTLNDREIKNIISSQISAGTPRQDLEQFIRYLIPNSVALNRLDSWHIARYGSSLVQGQNAMFLKRPEDLFPESFVSSYRAKGYQRANLSPEEASRVLRRDALTGTLGSLFADNPIAVKAALASGISKRSSRGILETKSEITRGEWEQFRESLYNELVSRGEGLGSRKVDFYSEAASDQDKLSRRLTSSTAGRAMLALHAVDKLSSPDLWIEGTGSVDYIRQKNEAKRILDQYGTVRYSPFMSENGQLDWGRKQNIAISESQNTQLLGRGQWKNNQDISDTVAVVSLAGYDKNNLEHWNSLVDLYRNGRVINGVPMVAQSTHGNGEDTVIRMISRSALEDVEKQERDWAIENGFSGSYFGNYTNAEIARRAALPVGNKDRLTIADLGKQFDAVNKGWSPSADMGIDLSDKRIALVDFGDKGDGAGWLASSVLPASIQGRFGVAGKGSLFQYFGKNNREFAEKNGLLDQNGRWMVKGLNGEEFDIADYEGFIPTSMIKNLLAYRNADGSLPSSIRASEMLTAAMRRYGIRAIADYDDENTHSDNLGVQMTSFMKISPELRNHQTEMLLRRMRELETEDGMLRHVFTDPQNDWLSSQVRQNRQLLATPAAISRVDAYRTKLLQDAASGVYTDYGNDDSSISDIRAAASPLYAFLASHGGITENVIAKARQVLEKAHGRSFSDEDIRNLIELQSGTAIDFNHLNDETISILRSPTGYRNMVQARNLAKEALPLYQAFGLSTTGAFVSDKDAETLQSADYDGDRFKVVTGKLADAIQASLDAMPKVEEQKVRTTPTAYPNDDIADLAVQNAHAAVRAFDEVMLMGTGSAGPRGMQLDLSNPSNNPYVVAEQKLQSVYDYGSVYHKKPEEVHLEGEKAIWGILGLGKEWTKFTDKLPDLFSFDADQMDEDGKPIIGKNGVFKAANGRLVNMRHLEQMGIENINLPSVNMDNHLLGLGQSRAVFRSGLSETSNFDAIAEALQQLSYKGAGEKTKRVMQIMRGLFPEFGTGARSELTTEETKNLRNAIADANSELAAEASKYLVPGTGTFIKDGREYRRREDLVSALEKEYGIHTARNAVDIFGPTHERLSRKLGESFVNDTLRNDASVKKIDDIAVVPVEEQTYIETPAPKAKASKKAGKTLRLMKQKDQNQIVAIEHIDYNPAQTMEDQYGKLLSDFAGIESSKLLASKMLDEFHETSKEYEKTIFSKSDQTAADKFFGLANWRKNKAHANMNWAQEFLSSEVFGAGTELRSRAEQDLERIDRDYLDATRKWSSDHGTSVLEGMRNSISGVGDEFSKQEAQIESYNNAVQDLMSTLENFEKSRKDKPTTPELKKQDDKVVADLRQQILQAQGLRDEGVQKILDNNNKSFDKSAESIRLAMNKETNTPVQNIDQHIQDVQNKIDKELLRLEAAKTSNKITEENYLKQKAAFDELKAYAETDLRNDLIQDRYNQQSERISTSIAHMDKLATSRRKRANRSPLNGYLMEYDAEVETRKQWQTEAEKTLASLRKDQANMKVGSAEYEKTAADIDKLTAAMKRNASEMQNVSGAAGIMNAAMSTAGTAVSRLAANFGRKMFSKALQEAKRFVQEFDQSMTEIQMITLKTDDQINQLGSHLIQTALDSGTTVSDVTAAASNLYRQGLSDEEVDERLDDVLKFAKVAGIKTDEASKIITTAMQNGLVGSSEEAMDALVALGDTAATTASEIAKGMQKSAASAKQAGMSYGELVTLLTIGTSKTQLGGSSIGSAVQTLMYRLYKINSGEDFYDENGNHIAATKTTEALGRMGVDMFENGSFRKPYQVLQDIAANWENADDVTQSAILSTLGAGRQRSNIATFIQGLAEDNGEIAGRYLNTAENSQGITDQKYQAYLDSLTAKINEVRTSWDQLVNTFEVSDFAGGTMEGIATFIQGITAAQEATNGWAISVPVLITALGALTAFVHTNPILAMLIGGATLLTAAVSGIGNIVKHTSPEYKEQQQIKQSTEKYETYTFNSISKISSVNDLIEQTRELGEAREEALSKGLEFDSGKELQLKSNLEELTGMFPALDAAFKGSTDIVSQWSQVLSEAGNQVSNFRDKSVEEARVLAKPVEANIIKQTREQTEDLKKEYAAVEQARDGALKDVSSVGEIDWIPTSQSYTGTVEQMTEFIRPLFLNENTKPYLYGNEDASKVAGDLLFGEAYTDAIEEAAREAKATLQTESINELVKNGELDFKNAETKALFEDLTGTRLNEKGKAANLERLGLNPKEYMRLLSLPEFLDRTTMRGLYRVVPDETEEMLGDDGRTLEHPVVRSTNLAGFNNGAIQKLVGVYERMWSHDMLPQVVDEPSVLNAVANEAIEGIQIGAKRINETLVANGAEPASLDPSSIATLYALMNATQGGAIYGDWTEASPVLESETLGKEKAKYEALLRFMYANNQFNSTVPGYYENEDQFIEDYRNGFQSYRQAVSGTEIDANQGIADLTADVYRIVNDADNVIMKAFANQMNEKLNSVYEAALSQMFGNNAEAAFLSGFDSQAQKAVTNKLKSDYNGDLSWLENENAAEIITAAIQEWAKNSVEFERNNLRVSDFPFSFKGVGYRTEEAAIEGIRQRAGMIWDNVGERHLGMSRNEYIESEIDQFKANSGTDFWGVLDQSRQAYEQENANALAADRVFEAISSGGVDSFAEFINAFNDGKIPDLSTVLNAFPELSNVIHSFAEDIGDGQWKIKDGIGDTSEAFSQLVAALAGVTKNYADMGSLSRNEIADAAEGFVANPDVKSQYRDEYESVVGKELARDLVRNESLTDLELLYQQNRLSNYRAGIEGLTRQQQLVGASRMFNLINNGQAVDMAANTAETVTNAYASGASGLSEYYGLAQRLQNETGNQMIDLRGVEEGSDVWNQYDAALKKVGSSAKSVQDQQIKINKALIDGQIDLNKTGDYADDYANSLKNLSKGGITATKELANLRSKALSSQDLITATQKGRGRSVKSWGKQTKELVAGALGISDAKDLEKYTQEELDSMLDSIEYATNEEFAQDNLQPILQNALDTLQSNMDPLELQQAINLDANMEGDLDISEVAAAVEQYDASLAAALRAYEGILAEYHARVTASSDGEGNGDVLAVGQVTANLKGAGRTGGYNRKSGGGGGGKSDAQKLIDQWKNDLTPYTHEVTMTQKYESHYERTGDYQGYLGAINTEYAATMNYANKLQDAISSLQSKMNSVAQGSDDWYALRDAVYSYQEALEDTVEALNDLNKKQIDALKTQHDNADIKFDHEEAILDTQLSRYQTQENYPAVYSTMNAQLENYQNQYQQSIEQANTWAKRMDDLAKTEGVDSQNYIEAWKNYNAEMEEAEGHLTNIVNKQKEIVDTQIEEISTNLNRAVEVPEVEIGIRSTLSTMAQENGSYDEAISQQNAIASIYSEMAEKAEESRQANLALMGTLKSGTPEWYAARTAMLEATKQVQQYTEANYEADKAAKQLAVDAVSYAYDIDNAAYQNQMKSAEVAQSIAEMNDDQPAIRTAIDQRSAILEKEIENDEKAIADLKELLDPQNGSIKPTDADYKTYVEELYAREQALADKVIEARQLQQERQQSILNEIKTTTSDSATAYSHMSNMMSRRIQDLQSDKEYDKIADVYGRAAEDAESRYNELGDEIEALQEALGEATDPAVVRELQALLNQKTEEQADAANAWRTSKDNQQNALANRVMEEYKEVQKYDELYTQLMTDLATRYQQNGDRTGYIRSLEESVNHLKDEQSEDQAYLEELNATLASLDEDNQAYAGLENERINLIKAMSARQNNIEKQELQVQAARIDNVQREQNQDASLRAHNLSMVQYEQSRYQNLGELRNYGILIEKENELHRKNAAEIGNEIAVLTQLRDGYDENGNKLITNADYINQLTEAIMKKEEAQKAENNAIEANIEKLRENQRAINQTRKALEDSVKAQIEAVEERNDSMLAGTVETEESIYEAIKKRYEDEWDLIKEDTQAKRDALNEEKEMLNERVNARKAARTAEDKQEQLAEYQRQAALLSLDPTRSKEVKEVQKKITDLQKELADLEYEKSIKSQTDVIEDQIEAMDKNEKYQEELRNEQLQDRNNFADEINRATGSLESYLKYFTEEEAEEFRNSTEAEREQMINQLIDRYYKAQGITDVDREGRSYQDTIRDILSTENEFISYMKENSQEYINGSDATRSILEYDWRKLWENNEDAEKTGAENFTFDDHEFFTMENSVSSIDKTIGDIKKLAEEFDLSTELNNLDLPSNATIAEIRKDIYAANDKTFSDYSGVVPKDKSNKTQEQVKKQADAIATDAATAKTETSTVPTTSDGGEEKNGWEQKDGNWYYYENDVPVTNAWKQIDGEWYRFDPDSKMQTGWYEDADHHWFYLDASGAMRKGWSQVGDQWYYHNDHGWMLTGNQTIAGNVEQFDEHGVWQGTLTSSGTASSGSTSTVPVDTTETESKYNVGWSAASNKYVISAADNGLYTKAEAKVIAANKNKEAKSATSNATTSKQPAGTAKAIDTSSNTKILGYDTGGLVDYTGPAWVDGTKEKPEAFLNWTDTKNIRSLLDAINTISISPGVVPDSSYFDGNNTSIGDIVITINQAELKSDEDIEVLAKRVGRAFTRELTKDGLNLAGYAF